MVMIAQSTGKLAKENATICIQNAEYGESQELERGQTAVESRNKPPSRRGSRGMVKEERVARSLALQFDFRQ